MDMEFSPARPSAGQIFPVIRGFAALSVIGVLVSGCSSSTSVAPTAKLKASHNDTESGGPLYGPRRAAPDRRSQPGPRRRGAGSIPLGGGYAKVGKPYRIGLRWYRPRIDTGYDRTGMASWYGTAFHGKKTANGEYFDMNRLTAAHPTLPLPSFVRVTNLANNRTIVVRINDRGPYARGRIIDLSRETARQLGFEHLGTARVRVRWIGKAPLNGDERYERTFLRSQPWYRRKLASR